MKVAGMKASENNSFGLFTLNFFSVGDNYRN